MQTNEENFEYSKLSHQLLLVKQEVDALQTQITERSRPWYQQASILIALSALIFSLGTTVISYYRTAQQDILASRLELRSLIKELTNHPKRSAEINKTYAGDPMTIAFLSGTLNTRNMVLAKQAIFRIRLMENSVFGKGSVLAVEYIALATALQNSNQSEAAAVLLEKAIELADDPNTAVGALRMSAGLAGLQNDVNSMRERMIAARKVFDDNRYSTTPQIEQDVIHAETEIQWWGMEASLNNCGALKKHRESAAHFINRLPNSPFKEQYKSRFNAADTLSKSCKN